MGVVFRARQAGPNREVALKVLGEPSAPAARARFLTEAEAAAAADHPHVVRVFDSGEAGGRPYLAMELCPGGTLADRLKDGPAGPAAPRAAAGLVRKLAGAVQALHDLGIVHRDLKPANVLFDSRGEPRVADFGLAKRAGADLTATQALMGTPAYMAPEQARGDAKYVGPAADVHALGAVLYELLAGTRPFAHPDQVALLRMVAEDPPAPLRKCRPAVPRDLELVCLRCLEKAPADRYPSAADLADDLGRFLAGEPVTVRPAGVLERAYKWARRRPAVAGLYAAAAAGAVLAAVAAGVGWLWRDAERARGEAAAALGDAEAARDRVAGEKQLTEDALGRLGVEQGKTAAALRDAEAARAALGRERDRLAGYEYGGAAQLAHQALGAGNLRLARGLLDGTRPEMRGWEWRYLDRVCRERYMPLRGHTGTVRSVVFSPDGAKVVTASADGTARVWDANTGAEVLALRGHTGTVRSARFSPGGGRVVTASGDGTARVWDANTGATVLALDGHTGGVMDAAFSPDGARLLTVEADRTVRLYDASPGGPAGRPLPVAPVPREPRR
jgi:hypothetical protein